MDNVTTRIAQSDAPPTDPPHELTAVIEDLQARLTKLEARDTRGLLGKLFGKGTMVALLLAVFLISGTAWAGTYVAFGGGQTSCGLWTTAEEESNINRPQYKQWLWGYLTAYSRWVEVGSGPVSDGDDRGPLAWIDKFCRDNPLERVGVAAERLVYEIKAK